MDGKNERKEILEDLVEKTKAKLMIGKVLFNTVFAPRAKELLNKGLAAVETVTNEVKDRLDPVSGLARHAKEAKENLKNKGLSDKDADTIVKNTVAGSLKKKKEKY